MTDNSKTEDESTESILRSLALLIDSIDEEKVRLNFSSSFLISVADEIESLRLRIENMQAEVARLERIASY